MPKFFLDKMFLKKALEFACMRNSPYAFSYFLPIFCYQSSQNGCRHEELNGGFVIEGGKTLYGAVLDSFCNHRIAMGFAIAGLVAEAKTEIVGVEYANISFPNVSLER